MTVAGKLLVALPIIVEDAFRRSVVLVLDHDEHGAFGVVINRPTELPVSAALPRWDERAAPPAVVFRGGPVQQDMAVALARDGDRVGPIDLDTDPSLLVDSNVRVFAGYAGWSPGQLDNELGEGAWAVVDAEPDDAFRADAADLWHAVLERQPQSELRRLAMLPDDLSVN